MNLLLDLVKPQHELLVATDPVGDRLSEGRVTGCLLLAIGELGLNVLLALVREYAAVGDAFAANLEALVHVRQWTFGVFEAVHAAAGALVIHFIEFLVQEGVVDDLSLPQSLEHGLEHSVVHVFKRTLVFGDLEELAQFFWGLVFWVKVHFCLFLQFVPVFELLLFPVLFVFGLPFVAGSFKFHACFLEHCWPI